MVGNSTPSARTSTTVAYDRYAMLDEHSPRSTVPVPPPRTTTYPYAPRYDTYTPVTRVTASPHADNSAILAEAVARVADGRARPDKEFCYELSFQLYGGKITVVPEAQGIDASWQKLPRWAAFAIAHARLRFLDGNVIVHRAYGDPSDERTWLPRMFRMEAFVDPRTQSVILATPPPQLPEAVTRAIRASENIHRLLAVTKIPSDDTGRSREVIERVAKTLPTSVLELLAATKASKPEFLTDDYMFTTEARFLGLAPWVPVTVAVLGAFSALGYDLVGAFGSAFFIGELAALPFALSGPSRNPLVRWLAPYRRKVRPSASGRYTSWNGNVLVDLNQEVRRTASVYVHELMHMVDFCTGKHGLLSSDPHFRAIYERTMRASNGAGALLMPSDYARTNVKEFFAEAACAFLDIPADENDPGTTELKEGNPELYAYFEELFTHRLPRALADKTHYVFKHNILETLLNRTGSSAPKPS